MKPILLILSIAFLGSCSTAYKSGQTPDDLYFSKGITKVKVDREDRYEPTTNTYEDRQIRMQAYDYRWRTLDNRYDYGYQYNPYQYGYNYGYYYNPYYCPFPVYSSVVSFSNPKNTTIRNNNLASYSNTITTYSTVKGSNQNTTTVQRRYNSSNTQTRRNTNYDSRTYSPSIENRTYSPSNNNNSNSRSYDNNNSSSAPARSSSSGSGTSVPRPTRGGN